MHAGMDRHGDLRPIPMPDTASYWRVAEARSAPAALSDVRTIGYPVFLDWIGRHDVERVPRISVKIYIACVLLFWAGLAAYTGSRWLAWAGAAPLLFASVLGLAERIQPDFLASALFVGAMGCLLWLTVRPRNLALWSGLVLLCFASYQVRPAYLFLLALVPAAGITVRWARQGRVSRPSWRWGLALVLATILPFLAFATVRKWIVGEFGLVSFTGFNTIGIAASMLGERAVGRLPDEWRPVAQDILRARQQRGFQPYRGQADLHPWRVQYNLNVWSTAVPILRHHIRQGQIATASGDARTAAAAPAWMRPAASHWITENRALRKLSREIFRNHPLLYWDWVSLNVLHGLRRLLDQPAIVIPVGLLVLAIAPLGLAAPSRRAPSRAAGAVLGVTLLASEAFAAHLGLICLVSFPSGRYFAAVTVLLPSMLWMSAFAVWQQIFYRA